MNCGKLVHSFLYISACTEPVEDRVACLLRPPRILKLQKEGSHWKVFVYILIVVLGPDAEVKPPGFTSFNGRGQILGNDIQLAWDRCSFHKLLLNFLMK